MPSPLLVGPAGKRPSLATCVAVCVKVCYEMYLAYVIVQCCSIRVCALSVWYVVLLSFWCYVFCSGITGRPSAGTNP